MTLVGRERELAALDALLDSVHETGGALVLHGEAGIGKSALLAHGRIARQAASSTGAPIGSQRIRRRTSSGARASSRSILSRPSRKCCQPS